MGAIGLSTGVIVGVALAWFINLAALPLLGRPVAFRFEPVLLFGSLVIASLVILLAAWWPAERATRLDILEALQYE